jgi:hypothetical protein
VIRRTDGPAPDVLRQRYGDFKTPQGDAIARVLHATGLAKRELAVDKNLVTMAWLIRNDAVVDGLAMSFADDADTRVARVRILTSDNARAPDFRDLRQRHQGSGNRFLLRGREIEPAASSSRTGHSGVHKACSQVSAQVSDRRSAS